MKRAAECFLTLHEIPTKWPRTFLGVTPSTQSEHAAIEEPESEAVSLYDTGLEAAEGLWDRT